jgi:hypothetical protein
MQCTFNLKEPVQVHEPMDDAVNYIIQKNYTNGYHFVICKSESIRFHLSTPFGTKLSCAPPKVHAKAISVFKNILNFTCEVFYSTSANEFIILDLFIWNGKFFLSKPYDMRRQIMSYFVKEAQNVINENDDVDYTLNDYLNQSRNCCAFNGIIYRHKIANIKLKYKFNACSVYIYNGIYNRVIVAYENKPIFIPRGKIYPRNVICSKYVSLCIFVELEKDVAAICKLCCGNLKVSQLLVNVQEFDIFEHCKYNIHLKNEILKCGVFKVFFDDVTDNPCVKKIVKIVLKPDISLFDFVYKQKNIHA